LVSLRALFNCEKSYVGSTCDSQPFETRGPLGKLCLSSRTTIEKILLIEPNFQLPFLFIYIYYFYFVLRSGCFLVIEMKKIEKLLLYPYLFS